MPRKPKSGNVTIKLGPKEVETILGHPAFRSPWGNKEQNIVAKLSKAVAEKFSSVAEDMEEENKASQICYGMQDSDEWKGVSASFIERRKVINGQYNQLGLEESQAMEKLMQAAFDRAGITHFKVAGYGFRRVEPSEVKNNDQKGL